MSHRLPRWFIQSVGAHHALPTATPNRLARIPQVTFPHAAAQVKLSVSSNVLEPAVKRHLLELGAREPGPTIPGTNSGETRTDERYRATTQSEGSPVRLPGPVHLPTPALGRALRWYIPGRFHTPVRPEDKQQLEAEGLAFRDL